MSSASNKFSQAILDSLPDLIREVVLEIGVNLEAPDQPTTSFNFVPPELLKAFKEGNYQAIDDFSNRSAKDVDPIYGNIQQNGDAAWIQIVNQSNNTPYWISIAGPPSAPTGYMWAYTPSSPPKGPADVGDDPSYIHTVQVGTLSRNSKFLGISNQLWDNKALSVTASVISTVVATVMTRYIAARIAGTAFDTAMTTAVTKAGTLLIQRGIVTQAQWIAGATFAAKCVGGAVAGAVLTLLIMFIAEFVWREYKCCINIYNWSGKPLSVREWWGDNAKLDDDQNFVVAALPPQSTTIVLPDGTSAPVLGNSVVSYATYVFANVNKFLEGLGVAMKVTQDDKSDWGVNLGYYLGRFADNKIALGSNMSQSLADFYKASSNWAAGGSLKYTIALPDGTPVTATTNALRGRDDQFYQYDVQIGLKPTANFGDDLPARPPKKLRDYPKLPPLLKVGQTITLPDGTQTEVVGKLAPDFII